MAEVKILNEIPKNNKMDTKDVFEDIYEKPWAIWTRQEPSKELIELVEKGKIKPCKVLEIGCGEGIDSIYLASKGFDVTGIDISENAIKYTKINAEKIGVNIKLIPLDLRNLEKIKGKFDFVLEWAIMHHIMPQFRGKYISHVNKLLNKNGKYLSVSFNLQSPDFDMIGKNYRTTPIGTKLYYSSLDELKGLFEENFEIIESKIINQVGREKDNIHLGNYFLMEKK